MANKGIYELKRPITFEGIIKLNKCFVIGSNMEIIDFDTKRWFHRICNFISACCNLLKIALNRNSKNKASFTRKVPKIFIFS